LTQAEGGCQQSAQTLTPTHVMYCQDCCLSLVTFNLKPCPTSFISHRNQQSPLEPRAASDLNLYLRQRNHTFFGNAKTNRNDTSCLNLASLITVFPIMFQPLLPSPALNGARSPPWRPSAVFYTWAHPASTPSQASSLVFLEHYTIQGCVSHYN
jgi:hypothetical protein